MAVKCVSAGGVPVDVMTPGDGGGSGGDVQIATTSKAGIVIAGDNINIESDGKISVLYGTPSRYGVLKIGSRLTGGSDGTVNVPTANRATAGVVKAGADLDFGTDGTINPYAATVTRPGIAKQAMPVADVVPVTVTDIPTAQEAIAEMGTTLAELMQSLRNAGVLGVSGS